MDSSKDFNEDSELSLKLFVVLSRALQAIEKQAISNIKSHGLNLTEFAVLELLFNKGDQPIQKIRHKVLLASSSITYVVDKLEERKYLVRKACPTDRRITHASLTSKGKELMEEVFPQHREALTDILGGVNADEKKTMIEQLKKLGLHAQDI